jgi:hypothetical protein
MRESAFGWDTGQVSNEYGLIAKSINFASVVGMLASLSWICAVARELWT